MYLLSEDEKFLIHDFRRKFLSAIRIRYVILIAATLLWLISIFNHFAVGAGPLLIIFLAGYNVAANISYKLKAQYRVWQMIVLVSIFNVCDVLAITCLIYLTGWLESPYWFMYLVLIILAGFGNFSQYSLVVFLIAFFSTFFYLGLLFLAYFGILPIYGPTFSLPPQELLRAIINKAVFTIVSLFLFSSTVYYFSKLLFEHQRKLSQKNRELLIALEELKGLDKLKDEFMSTASHELRTPLAVIRENISLIVDGVIGTINEKQRQLVKVCLANVDRLAQILDSLLDISKIETQALGINRTPTDISPLAEKAVALLKGLANQRGISLKLSVTSGAITLADPEQIVRVFINLIDNAIKYSPVNGQIEVEVKKDKNVIRACVSDNGIGVEEEDQPLLFRRFIRLDRADKIGLKGAGLGLSICKTIMDVHGGKIWVESKPGAGAKFIFTLPVVGANG